jgi:hypothetical protein
MVFATQQDLIDYFGPYPDWVGVDETHRGKAMIDYTQMFTAIQAAEKELRGMGLRVTPGYRVRL